MFRQRVWFVALSAGEKALLRSASAADGFWHPVTGLREQGAAVCTGPGPTLRVMQGDLLCLSGTGGERFSPDRAGLRVARVKMSI